MQGAIRSAQRGADERTYARAVARADGGAQRGTNFCAGRGCAALNRGAHSTANRKSKSGAEHVAVSEPKRFALIVAVGKPELVADGMANVRSNRSVVVIWGRVSP